MWNWRRLFGYSQTVYLIGSGATAADVYTESPEGLAATVCAIERLSTDVSRVRAKVVDAAGIEVPSPVGDLLNGSANRAQSGYAFRRFLTASSLRYGNGLAIIRRNAAGGLEELIPVLPHLVGMAWADTGPVYRVGGELLPADEVLHIGAIPDPTNPFWFLSPLEAAPAVFTTACGENTAHRTLAKTGLPGKLAVESPNKLDDGVIERIKRRFKELSKEEDGVAEPLVLQLGMKANALFPNNSDWILKAREFSVREIARVFDVPVELLHHAQLASQAETARAYVDGGLARWASAWAAEVQQKLLPPGQRLVLETRALLKGNLKDQGMGLSKLVLAGVMTPNEARTGWLDLDRMQGGDELTVSMPGAALGNDMAGQDQVANA